jgi:hypothetical protein
LYVEQDRIEFDRGPLTEWFVNTPEGLEHGFTVPVRPRAEGDRLVFDLAIAGGLRSVFAEDGQAIDFFYPTGSISVLRYGKLVSDAPATTFRHEWNDRSAESGRRRGQARSTRSPSTPATSPSWTAGGPSTVRLFGGWRGRQRTAVRTSPSERSPQHFRGKGVRYLGTASVLPTRVVDQRGESGNNQLGERAPRDVNGRPDLVVAAPLFLRRQGVSVPGGRAAWLRPRRGP